MSRNQLDINFFDRPAIENPWPLYEQVRAAAMESWERRVEAVVEQLPRSSPRPPKDK